MWWKKKTWIRSELLTALGGPEIELWNVNYSLASLTSSQPAKVKNTSNDISRPTVTLADRSFRGGLTLHFKCGWKQRAQHCYTVQNIVLFLCFLRTPSTTNSGSNNTDRRAALRRNDFIRMKSIPITPSRALIKEYPAYFYSPCIRAPRDRHGPVLMLGTCP